jgi:hypothetical protein
MEKVRIFTSMEINMLVNGKRVKNMGKEFLRILVEKLKRVFGKKIN